MTNNEKNAKEIVDLLVANRFVGTGDYTSIYLVTLGVLNRGYSEFRDCGEAGKKAVVRNEEGEIIGEQG